MRSTSLAVLLGIPIFLAFPVNAFAQSTASFWPYGCGNGTTCGSKLTSILNQHGPLYNYGPYYGYPPFEPYGPWNAYLQYNPWYYGVPNTGGGWGCSVGDLTGHGPFYPSWHSSWMHGGWYHGCSTCSHGGLFTSHCGWTNVNSSTPCSSCGSSAPAVAPAPAKGAMNTPSSDARTQLTGVGNAADFAGFYKGLPTLDLSVVPAGGEQK